jgi:predicted DNA-binding transcriptional regulator AlpA
MPNAVAMQAKRGRRMLRPKEIWTRLGCKKSKFYDYYVGNGLVNLIDLGDNSVGAPEDEIDALIDTIIEKARAKAKRRRAIGKENLGDECPGDREVSGG